MDKKVNILNIWSHLFQAAIKYLDTKYFNKHQALNNHHLVLKLISQSFASYINISSKYKAH